MQKHDFEKQVQEKLEELSFTPSAPVWQKIEEQIRKKRDKRRIVFWLLPMLLTGIGIVGYLFYHPAETVTKSNRVPVNHTSQHPFAKRHSNTIDPATQKEAIITHQNDLPSAAASKKLITAKQQTISHYFNISNSSFLKKNNGQQLSIEEMNMNPYQTEKTGTNLPMINRRNEAVELIQVAIRKDSLLQLKPVTTIKVTPKNDVVVSSDINEKKWRWSAFMYIGNSNIHNSLIGALSLDKSADAYMSPVPIGSGTTGPGSYALPPSPTTKGRALAAGVDVKRKIRSRTFLTTGIHYAYYSTHMYVGQKIPDSVNGRQNSFAALSYYSNTNRMNNYQNRYYFIEVPIGIDYQLLKHKPLYVHTGISMAQLIKSHALHYEPTRNLYYQTNQFLNKTQINWVAGITYQFSVHKHISVEVGPQIQYGLRALQYQYLQEKLHLFSSGIKMNFSLK